MLIKVAVLKSYVCLYGILENKSIHWKTLVQDLIDPKH